MDIENLADIKSLIKQRKLRCCSTSLHILVLGYILILGLKLGLKLKPNSIAS